jgi:hypothetical protein
MARRSSSAGGRDKQEPEQDPLAGDVEAAWKSFLAKYSPEIQRQMRAAREKLRSRIPRGFELVYDNYNALATGFGPTDRSSAAVISLAAYPRWITLFFLHGAGLDDPDGMLDGAGSRVRSVRLQGPETMDDPRVARLIEHALRPHAAAFAQAPALSTLIKSVSAKQRPRRPATSVKSRSAEAGRRTRRSQRPGRS